MTAGGIKIFIFKGVVAAPEGINISLSGFWIWKKLVVNELS
ncbi:hypothetical protein [Pelotomaculum terephthalicicum]